MSTTIGISMCYEPGSITGGEFVSLFEKTKFFEPAQISVGKAIPPSTKFKYSHLKKIAAMNAPLRIKLEAELKFDPDARILSFDRSSIFLFDVEFFQGLYLHCPESRMISLELLHDLANKDGFRAGFCHSDEDTHWQEEDQIKNYEFYNRAHKNLPRIWDNDRNRWKFDISRNPARREMLRTMWFQAAWRMWFGNHAFRYFPKETLLSFRDADVISALPNGTVFIQLFDDPLAYGTTENRRRQQAFRDHVKIDLIVKALEDNIRPLYETDEYYFNPEEHGKKVLAILDSMFKEPT